MSDITEFFEAVNGGDTERARLLLEANPDLVGARDVEWTRRLVTRHPWIVDAKDAGGKTLAAYARECGDRAIADLFSSAAPQDHP